MSPMEWLNVVIGLVSGAAAAGVVIGVSRTQVAALRRDLELMRQEHKEDIRECRSRLDKLMNGHHHET